jgi:hypothetical protein
LAVSRSYQREPFCNNSFAPPSDFRPPRCPVIDVDGAVPQAGRGRYFVGGNIGGFVKSRRGMADPEHLDLVRAHFA